MTSERGALMATSITALHCAGKTTLAQALGRALTTADFFRDPLTGRATRRTWVTPAAAARAQPRLPLRLVLAVFTLHHRESEGVSIPMVPAEMAEYLRAANQYGLLSPGSRLAIGMAGPS